MPNIRDSIQKYNSGESNNSNNASDVNNNDLSIINDQQLTSSSISTEEQKPAKKSFFTYRVVQRGEKPT